MNKDRALTHYMSPTLNLHCMAIMMASSLYMGIEMKPCPRLR